MPEQPINANAAKFIDWAVAKLDDKAIYEAAVTEIRNRVNQFYDNHSQEELVGRLKAKLTRGAQEHGEPFYSPEVLTEEITNEYIDLLGWMLIEEWNQKHSSPELTQQQTEEGK